MDNGALFLMLLVLLMVGWALEPKSKPATPIEELEKAVNKLAKVAIEKAAKEAEKGQGGS